MLFVLLEFSELSDDVRHAFALACVVAACNESL